MRSPHRGTIPVLKGVRRHVRAVPFPIGLEGELPPIHRFLREGVYADLDVSAVSNEAECEGAPRSSVPMKLVRWL